MGAFALLCAVAAAAAVAIPGVGKFVAVGLGLYAALTGLLAHRREARAGARLFGAAGAAVGLVAFVLGGAKVGLTLVALEHLARLGR
jgi:hypothetical protein